MNYVHESLMAKEGPALNKEPVATATIVPIIIWCAAHFGFDVDEDGATAIAGAVLVILGLFARQTVTPLANPHNNEGQKLVPQPPPTIIKEL